MPLDDMMGQIGDFLRAKATPIPVDVKIEDVNKSLEQVLGPTPQESQRNTQVALAQQRASRLSREKWIKRGASVLVGAAAMYVFIEWRKR